MYTIQDECFDVREYGEYQTCLPWPSTFTKKFRGVMTFSGQCSTTEISLAGTVSQLVGVCDCCS